MAEIYDPKRGTLGHVFSTAASIIDKKKADKDIKKGLVKAGKIEKDNEDLLYIEFVLCHEGVNANRDEFVLQELRDHFDTIIYKDINVEHSDKIVGCVTDAELVEQEAEARFTFAGGFKPHIVCSAVIYQFKFPDVAKEIIDRHAEGNLRFSMEVWFKQAQCSQCSEKFKATAEYCEHLTNRFASGSKTSRKLLEITFGGAAVVENPADPDAKGLSVAARIIDSWEANYIAEGIGMSFENLELVLEKFFQILEDDELINQDVVKQKTAEVFSKFMKSEESSASKKGDKAMAKYEFETVDELMKDEDVKDAVKAQIEAVLAERDEQVEIESLRVEKERLEKEVETANKAKEEIENEYKQKEEARKLDELVETRFAELTEAGVKYEEDRVEKVKARLRKMDAEEYAEYKADMLMNVEASEEDEEEEEVERITATIPVVPSDYSKGSKTTEFEWEKDFAKAVAGWRGTQVDNTK